ncbi:MAG: hypothetical protein ACOY94_00245 [Bacillota bacterium]
MRHMLVIEVQEGSPLPLMEPFEVGSLGAEFFSHVTLVCRRIPPFELSLAEMEKLRSALHSGLLWGHDTPAAPELPKSGALVSHVRMLTEQPDGNWIPAHDFELGR